MDVNWCKSLDEVQVRGMVWTGPSSKKLGRPMISLFLITMCRHPKSFPRRQSGSLLKAADLIFLHGHLWPTPTATPLSSHSFIRLFIFVILRISVSELGFPQFPFPILIFKNLILIQVFKIPMWTRHFGSCIFHSMASSILI